MIGISKDIRSTDTYQGVIYDTVGIGRIILNFKVILHFPAIQMFLFLFEFPTLSKFLIQNFKKAAISK